jgi:hypothetical protein
MGAKDCWHIDPLRAGAAAFAAGHAEVRLVLLGMAIKLHILLAGQRLTGSPDERFERVKIHKTLEHRGHRRIGQYLL